MLVCGSTGDGKTRLCSQLLECRDYVVVIALKRYDDTLKVFIDDILPTMQEKYHLYKTWPPLYSHDRVVLWLRPLQVSDIPKQKEEFRDILQKIYVSGGWTVDLDDANYASGFLKAATEMGVLLNQGRSSKLSIVCSIQQPKSLIGRLPSEVLRQPRHKIFFNLSRNSDDLQGASDIAGIDMREMTILMHQLGEYEFLYVGKKYKMFHVVQQDHPKHLPMLKNIPRYQ